MEEVDFRGLRDEPRGGQGVEQVRDGLPEWLDGKIDTAQLAVGGTCAAMVSGAGQLWVSQAGCAGWKCLAADVDYPFGLSIVPESSY